MFLLLAQTTCAQIGGRLRERIRERIERKKAEKTNSADNQIERQIQVGDLTRTYLVHAPASHDKNKASALLLAFHGGGGKAGKLSDAAGDLDAFSNQHDFIVVYPQGVDDHWNDGRKSPIKTIDDVGFVSALIEQIARDYNVDRRKVYAAGISNGGMFAQRLACELPDKIIAVASVAALMPENLAARCSPPRAVAVLVMHGTDDPLIPFEGGEIKGSGKGGYGGKTLSAVQTIEFWVKQNKISTPPTINDFARHGFDR